MQGQVEELTLPVDPEAASAEYVLDMERESAAHTVAITVFPGGSLVQDAQDFDIYWTPEEATSRLEATIGSVFSMVSPLTQGARVGLLTQTFRLLHTQNEDLRLRINELEDRLSHLEDETTAVKTVVLRELDREEAKEEIRQLFASGETLYYSDIVERLGIDLELVVDISRELIDAGEVIQ